VSRRVLLTTDVVGGVWDFCITLAQGLRCAGDDIVLLAFGTPSLPQRQAASAAGAQLLTAPLKLEWMQDAADDIAVTLDLVGQVARESGADVVHANQFAAACAQTDTPVVLTLHSDVLSWRKWTLGALDTPPEWQTYAALVREALHRADRVASVSRFLADEVSALYAVSRQIEVVHNGWSAPAPSSIAREHSTVVAGRLWDAAKNISLVAEAAHGWYPGTVYLAGDNTHPDGGTAPTPDVFTPVGFLAREDMDTLLKHARVYISAAKYDPFGLLPLQAALHGCQLLLSDIPSYREIWGDTATYFRSGDAEDLRAKWRYVLEATPKAAAAKRARTELSADCMVEQYRRVYASARRAIAA
jgi:glycogen synthase